jgi:DNA processing protein
MGAPVSAERRALLALLRLPRIGSHKLRVLVDRFGSARSVLSASLRELVQVEGIDRVLAERIRSLSCDRFVDDQVERLIASGVNLVTYWDSNYPPLLKEIYDPPILLFVQGSLTALSGNCVAVVGTRSASSYGKLMAETFSRELVKNGFTIVSGLARGIDTIAHWTAMNAGGKTLAILGSSVDCIYPGENESLAQRITTNGALLSEFPLGTKPEAPYFPRRNRIIAGLSQATLVIEAGEKSGALITADFAVEQGRDVYAVPGNINSPKSTGTNRLIQDGAKLITCCDDILEELCPLQVRPACEQMTADMTLEEGALFNQIPPEPIYIDDLASRAQLSSQDALSLLLSLELKAVVRQLPGKYFIRL